MIGVSKEAFDCRSVLSSLRSFCLCEPAIKNEGGLVCCMQINIYEKA